MSYIRITRPNAGQATVLAVIVLTGLAGMSALVVRSIAPAKPRSHTAAAGALDVKLTELLAAGRQALQPARPAVAGLATDAGKAAGTLTQTSARLARLAVSAQVGSSQAPGKPRAAQSQSQAPASTQTVGAADADQPTRTFAGRPIEKVRTIEMEVTAYSPGPESCGKWADGQTASGYSVQTNGGHLVAADTDLLPFGTIVTVPGYDNGEPVPVLDRGGAIEGKRLDVLFPTRKRALQWGRQTVTVTVWRYADEPEPDASVAAAD